MLGSNIVGSKNLFRINFRVYSKFKAIIACSGRRLVSWRAVHEWQVKKDSILSLSSSSHCSPTKEMVLRSIDGDRDRVCRCMYVLVFRLTSSTFGMVAEMAINRMLALSRLSLFPDVLFRVMVDWTVFMRLITASTVAPLASSFSKWTCQTKRLEFSYTIIFFGCCEPSFVLILSLLILDIDPSTWNASYIGTWARFLCLRKTNALPIKLRSTGLCVYVAG